MSPELLVPDHYVRPAAPQKERREPDGSRGWSCWDCGRVWGRVWPGSWLLMVGSEFPCEHPVLHATHLTAGDIPTS